MEGPALYKKGTWWYYCASYGTMGYSYTLQCCIIKNKYMYTKRMNATNNKILFYILAFIHAPFVFPSPHFIHSFCPSNSVPTNLLQVHKSKSLSSTLAPLQLQLGSSPYFTSTSMGRNEEKYWRNKQNKMSKCAHEIYL